MSYKILVVSDLHLGEPHNDVRYPKFLALFDEFLMSDVEELLLMGDIFDILIGNKEFWKKIHPDFFQKLQKAKDLKKKVTWVQGNHDFQLEKLIEPYGVYWIDEHEILERAGLRISVTHGDLADDSNKLHPLWRKLLSSWFLALIIRLIPEGIGEKHVYPFTLKLSRTSRKISRASEYIERGRQIFRDYAARLQKTHNAQLVILGHSHISDHFQLSPEASYLNLGSWFEAPQVGLLSIKDRLITVKVSPLSSWLPSASK